MRNAGRSILILLLAAIGAACGGGGGDGGGVDTTAAAGLYHGTATNSNSHETRNIDALVLEDGTFWSIYSVAVGSGLGGAMQGSGSLNGDTFTARAKNFYWEDGMPVQVLTATASATYVSGTSFSGSVTYADGSSDSVVTTYDADFDIAPSLANIAGDYSGLLYPSGGGAHIIIDASGNLSGSTSEINSCHFSGTVTPRVVGNVYNVVSVKDPATCSGDSTSFRGVIFLENPGPSAVLKLAVLDSGRTSGVVFVGSYTK